MARTPVTTEVIEKPKRTPVLVDEDEHVGGTPREPHADDVPPESMIERGATLKELMVASENGAMDAKSRHEIKPIIDGYRECARPDCGASFKPKSLNPKDDDVTEYYCSSDCAISEFYRKRNLGPVPEKIVSGAATASSRAHREEKKRERVVKNAEAETKHGPLRNIASVLETRKGSKRVRYECGHDGTVGARASRGRCRQCRGPVEAKKGEKKHAPLPHVPVRQPVAESGGATERGRGRDVPGRRQDQRDSKASRADGTRAGRKQVPARAEASKPVKRQPVTRSTVKKSKRTPVKPPKRGKKGKR